MSIRDAKTVSGEKTQVPLPKEGNRLAVLTGIIDIGRQQNEYRGEKKNPRQEFIPEYTLIKDTYEDEDGEVRHIKVRPYPLGLLPGAEKGKYRIFYTAHDPEGTILAKDGSGDITKLIGTAVQVRVEYTDPNDEGLVYANMNANNLTPLPEDYPVPEIDYEPLIFDLHDPDRDVFDNLGSWTQDKIRGSLDYVGSDAERILDGSEGKGKSEGSVGPNEEDDDSPV